MTQPSDDFLAARRRDAARHIARTCAAHRLGMLSEDERKAGVEACRIIYLTGTRNVRRTTINDALAVAPEWIIKKLERDGDDVTELKAIILDTYRRNFAGNPAVVDVFDEALLEEAFIAASAND